MNGSVISQPIHVSRNMTSDTPLRCSSSCWQHATVAGDPVSLKCSDRTPWPRKAETAEDGRRAADQLAAQRSVPAGSVRHHARDSGSASSRCVCIATTRATNWRPAWKSRLWDSRCPPDIFWCLRAAIQGQPSTAHASAKTRAAGPASRGRRISPSSGTKHCCRRG